MKLLLDENVSRRVLPQILGEFPGSNHLAHLNMLTEDDITIWDYAEKNGFTIVSKDKDFIQLSILKGHPPKIIHLTIGNGPIVDLVDIINKKSKQIKEFGKRSSKSYLLLGR